MASMTCQICGAAVETKYKHDAWHATVTGELQELERRIEELKRSSR